MTRLLLASILILTSLMPAMAFDKRKIVTFCKSNYAAKTASLKLCLGSEAEAAKTLERLRDISTAPAQIMVLNICEEDYKIDYASALDCVMRTLDQAEVNIKKQKEAVPEFNTIALCKKVSANVGGSYSVEKTCRDQEQNARAEVLQQYVETDIMQICARVALNVGGSYQTLKTCVEQETAAKAALQ